MKHYRQNNEGNGTFEINTREKVLEVALELFASRGFKGTSIRDIAKAMNMSISNIYHYFGSKEGILVDLYKTSSERLINGLKEASLKDLPPLELYRLLLGAHVRFFEKYPNESKLFAIDPAQLSPAILPSIREVRREVLLIYIGVLEKLQEVGALRTKNLRVLALNAFAVLNWPLRWYRAGGDLSMDEVCEEMISFIVNGSLVPGFPR